MSPMDAGVELESIHAGIAFLASIAVTIAAGCVAMRENVNTVMGLNQKRMIKRFRKAKHLTIMK